MPLFTVCCAGTIEQPLSDPEQNYHELLRQFEELNRGNSRVSPLQFLDGLPFSPPHEFQLEVIAVDVQLWLTQGVKPAFRDYMSDFPWLQDDIPELYTDAVESFVGKFCPVRHSLGETRSTEDYEIGKEIGRGGMGVVYEAVQKSFARPVAIKVLFLSRDSIFDEAKKAALLSHRNVCRIYEAGRIGKFPFMSMQLIRGRSLKEVLVGDRPGIEGAVSIVSQIANALAAAHRENLMHLDVKPENITVNQKGEAWLMDFGISKQYSEITDESNCLQPVSPTYCAPEQLSVEFGDRGAWSDIYSLGLVLYKLLCGRAAYMGDYSQIVDQIHHDPPRRLVDYDDRISEELDAVCRKAIAKKPADRFSSMQEFREALVACSQ